jgi:OOP family OmpA-OmpF porin
MKKIQGFIITLLASSSFVMAGGDILTVTPFEVEDVAVAEIEVVPEVIPPAPLPIVKEIVTPPVVESVIPPVVPAVASVSGAYVGLGLVASRYDTNCVCTSKKSGIDKTAGLVGRVGYDFNQYIGVEARGMITKLKDDGGTIKHAGAFVKPMYPITNALNTYGLVGLAKTTTQGDLRRTDVSGLALGLGLEYDLSADNKKDAQYDREFDGMADQEKGFGLFADYEKLYYKSGSPKLDTVSVGVTYDF